jgi:O-acetyl-ADP-ribose deacetylase (regulator of RNase III)
MQVKVNNTVLELREGDITEMDVDAIVNAANAQLVLGGGVAGAIAKKGGPEIQKECDKVGPCYVGGAAITTGGNLKARYVIHAVGPRMGEGDEDEKLKGATESALRVADENRVKTIALPAISSGIFGFPIERCAKIMLAAAVSYAMDETGLERIIFSLFTRESYKVFETQLRSMGL